MEAAAAPPLSLPQQQRQAQPPQSLPFTRGEAGASSSGGGGNNSNTNQHHQTTHAARIAEAVARDLAALSNPDVSSPFASADDAIDRLLPYHLLAQEGPEAADADEVGASETSTAGRGGSGAGGSGRKLLLLSRRQAWLEVASRRASAACDAAARTEARADEAVRRSKRACEERREELWLVARWEREEAEAGLWRARRAAAAAPAAATAAAAAAAPSDPPAAP